MNGYTVCEIVVPGVCTTVWSYIPRYLSFSFIALCNAKGEKGNREKKRVPSAHRYLTHQPTSLDMGTCKGLERESESRISVKGERGEKYWG